MKMLENIIVLDFSQYLSGPWAAMRLGDLGARVIKIEGPRGDGSRKLTLKNIIIDGDSSVFHSMNRGKESYTANLKDENDLIKVKKLIAKADVMISNFRPGIMERLGLGYDVVKEINPRMIYASITGYGTEGPWVKKPGQDLLLQSVSGIPYLNGNEGDNPVPVGLAVIDMFTSANTVQAILAALIQRGRTSQGALVECSMIEAALDYQFEPVTTYLNDGGELQPRSAVNNGHAYLGAPYGVYKTKDNYIALSMGNVSQLGELLGCDAVAAYTVASDWYDKRDEIKQLLADYLLEDTTANWLARLEPADYWCGPVYNMREMMNHEAMDYVDMVQEVARKNGTSIRTTRCPMRINGEKVFNNLGAPVLGEDNERIDKEFGL